MANYNPIELGLKLNPHLAPAKEVVPTSSTFSAPLHRPYVRYNGLLMGSWPYIGAITVIPITDAILLSAELNKIRVVKYWRHSIVAVVERACRYHWQAITHVTNVATMPNAAQTH